MSLFLSCSNRVEALQVQLAALLGVQPLSKPLQPELIIVPSMAMKRWVNLQLAMRHGVAANIQYPLPAAWIWTLAAQASGQGASLGEDPLSRDNAAWRIFALLPSLLEQEQFQELDDYLREDESGIKRWQLAQRLADIFDRYQYYRPEWIRKWSAGQHHDDERGAQVPAWQVILWRELIKEFPHGHRVALIDNLLAALHSESSRQTILQDVPERISCFALSSLPPLFVQVLHALAQSIDIYFFQHSPTDQYWADLRSQKEQARQRLSRPEEAIYYDTGNELLASWGRQGQAFQDLLLNAEGIESTHWEAYLEAGNARLLHRLQDDILHLHNEVVQCASDESIEISVCHSPMRECQVLHDRILAAIDDAPSLKPEDILVMVPEISRYAPYIEAVFRFDEKSQRPFLPWNLSDISVADEHPLIRVFLKLLELPSSRFSFSELTSYLEVPQLAAQFGLEGAVQEDLLSLLRASQIRWGIDAEHKRNLGLPDIAQNTWAHGIDRLLAGYAMTDIALWQGVAPLGGATGAGAAALGRFCAFLESLKHWHLNLQEARSARQWQRALNAMLETLFGTLPDEDDRLQQIRDALDELGEQAGEQTLSIDLLSLCLEESLGNRVQHNRFFTGGVTICGMRPMRSLPFRMICVLGLNDAAFPRRDQSQSFDAMGKQWRPGDPRKGDEDRYLLLETILCARDKLYLSYTGKSLKDNSELQASVLLREFIDFIDKHYVPENDASSTMTAHLCHAHAMQAFSWRQFDNAPLLRSYDAWWCQIAQALQEGRAEQEKLSSWPSQSIALPDEELEQVELDRLSRFLQHPVKGFFNSRLGIYLRDEEEGEDDEVFALDGLQTWQMHNELIGQALQGVDESGIDALQALYSAQGMLPHGAMAENAYTQMRIKAVDMLTSLQPYYGLKATPLAIAIPCVLPDAAATKMYISGQIRRYYPGHGLLHYTPSAIKPKYILGLWLEHLALCAKQSLASAQHSVLYCRDAEVRFPVLAKDEALAQLGEYLYWYREGLTRPLPLFPTASYEVALDEGDAALGKARRKWVPNEFGFAKADSQDPYIALVYRHCAQDPLAEDEHLRLAQAFFGQARKLGEGL